MKSFIAFGTLVAASTFYYQGNISTAICFGLISILLILYDNSEGYKYPPTPFALPILGHLPWLMFQDRNKYIMKLHEKYGNIITLQFGKIKNVNISDYDTIKEFSNHPDFQGRPQLGLINDLLGGNGVIDSEGERWKELRRFFLHSLRDSGMGKLKVQEKIIEELQYLSEEIHKKGQNSFSLDILFHKLTCNVIYNVAFDLRFDYDNPDFIDRLSRLNQNVRLGGRATIAFLLPGLSFLNRSIMKILQENVNVFKKESENVIQGHKKSLDENNPRDLVDLFLIEMNKSGKEEDKEYLNHFTEKQLQFIIIDLFVAGTETSSTSTKWAIAFMVKHPEIQKKVQAEIDEVIGQNRTPTMEDKLRLPFTTATLQEIERLGSIAPDGVPRSNPKAAKFKGFTFPPRVMFTLNLYGVHRDPKLWKNPDKFDPSRFIDSEGKVFRPPYLIPFGSGRRNCAGESLARMEIFLIFVSLMQQFQFTVPNQESFKIEIDTASAVRAPVKFDVCARQRM